MSRLPRTTSRGRFDVLQSNDDESARSRRHPCARFARAPATRRDTRPLSGPKNLRGSRGLRRHRRARAPRRHGRIRSLRRAAACVFHDPSSVRPGEHPPKRGRSSSDLLCALFRYERGSWRAWTRSRQHLGAVRTHFVARCIFLRDVGLSTKRIPPRRASPHDASPSTPHQPPHDRHDRSGTARPRRSVPRLHGRTLARMQLLRCRLPCTVRLAASTPCCGDLHETPSDLRGARRPSSAALTWHRDRHTTAAVSGPATAKRPILFRIGRGQHDASSREASPHHPHRADHSGARA